MHEVGLYIERFRNYVTEPHLDLSFSFVNSLSPDNKYFEATNLFPIHTYSNVPCRQVSGPISHTLVDGRVTVCCRDYDGSLVIGDVRQQSLADILRGDAMRAMQRAHAAHDVSAYALCGTCFIVDNRIGRAFRELTNYGGYSADSLDRPALKELLRDLRDGRLNCVLAYKIDRLTRSVRDFHQLMDLFDRYGVKFVSVTQSLDTQNPMGRLLRNVLLDFAQFEREMTADRTRDKMLQRAQKGMWNGGHPPYGYAAKDKRLVVNAPEAERLRFMFQRFAEAPSLARLRDELHRLGWYARSGQPWSKTAVDQILRNPVYCGFVRFHEQQFRGAHDALIEEHLFRKVQSVRRDRSHPSTKMTRVFLLKGLMRCADCGSWMTPHYTQKRHKDGSVYRIPYYRCTKTMHFDNAVCSIKHINADQIERQVVEKLSDLAQNEAFVKMSVEELNGDLKRRTEPLEAEAAQLKKRLEEIE